MISDNERIGPRPIGEPLSDWEKAHPLFIAQPAAQSPTAFNKAMYGINSTCLEIIDHSHIMRHEGIFGVFALGPIAFLAFFGPFVYDVYSTIAYFLGFYQSTLDGQPEQVASTFIALPVFAVLSYGIYRVLRRILLGCCFYYKRLPIRFNRKTQTIYAYRGNQPGEIWEIPWKDGGNWYFCIAKPRAKPGGWWGNGRIYSMALNLQAYELDDKGLITKAFCLGPAFLEGEQAVREYWEYYRQYMNNGPEGLAIPPFFWSPKEDEPERIAICTSEYGKKGGIGRALGSPLASFDAIARLFSLATSKEIAWPDEIEKCCQPEPNDPFQHPLPGEPVGLRYEKDRPVNT